MTTLSNRISDPARHPPTNGNGNGHAAPQHDNVEAVPVPPPPKPGIFKLLALLVVIALLIAGMFVLGWMPLQHREAALAAEVKTRADEPQRVAVVSPKRAPAVTELDFPGDVQA